MLRNYIKTAWRNLVNHKFFSVLNMLGLAIGLAVGMMILIWVEDEFSYDSFHKQAKNIYKVNSHLGAGADLQVWDGIPAPISLFAKQSVPEVENAVRVDHINIELLFRIGDKKYLAPKRSMAFVDSSFFKVFDFGMEKGNPKSPFQNMNSIVISSKVAKNIFGKEDPMGKTMATEFGNFIVTGVMNDFPQNSTLNFDMLLPMAWDADYFAKAGGNGDWKTMDEDLGNFSFQTYFLIKPGTSPQMVGKKITQLFRDKKGPDAKDDSFVLQPLTDRHLVTIDGNRSALQTVRIFLGVAILILVIACINYVNLATARAMLRSKEVSMRKIIGAERIQLFIQFIAESALMFMFSTLLAFLIIYTLLPLYNDISGKNLVFDLSDGKIIMTLAIAIVGTLALASIYPAALLSAFKPLHALKGEVTKGMGKSTFRKVLVVTQFVFSVALIVSTIVIGNQLRFIRSMDIGYNREQIFSFQLRDSLAAHSDAVRQTLLSQPGVLAVSGSSTSILGEFNSTGDTEWEGKQEGRMFLIHTNFINKDFIPLLGMKMAAGSNFTGEGDSAHFILNETAVREAGIKNPIGQRFQLWNRKGTIIGVVKDFNYATLRKKISPLIFVYSKNSEILYVKTTGREASKAISAAQNIWKQYGSDYPFSYSFLEEDFGKMYEADQRTGVLFNVFTVVAIFISCLGLFGLATFTAQVKTKEIGIRKVLGASIFSITNMLAKEFLLLVFLAFVIASPIAWWAMDKWLQNYAYRVNISGWVFLLTAVLAMLIALIAVCFQSVRAALANPIKSLRTE